MIVPRGDHTLSRRDIDPDALKVLYRLHDRGHIAYLVGGSVRDILLGRRPKDFDIGTDAHPYQVKKLFRNCWIIGRRFRLAHVKFGTKVVEVATFRRIVADPSVEPGDAVAPPDQPPVLVAATGPPQTAEERAAAMLHRDNTFGTPEEDAFRRDFTINALFYDIATYSIIDYVGGLADLEARVIKSIGDPRVRFVEDPVRMLRAGVMAARLGFDLDPLVVDAIGEHRALITKASPARLMEEYYKILRSGFAEAVFRTLGRLRLLELITPELKSPSDAVWESLARVDRYRQRFASVPPELTTTILVGALLHPLGMVRRPPRGSEPSADRIQFGMLPVPKKDLERLRQANDLLPRLLDPGLPPRVARGIVHRPAFDDALTWLEVFGDSPDGVASWREMRQHRKHAHAETPPQSGHVEGHPAVPAPDGQRKRRRRRRRRRKPPAA